MTEKIEEDKQRESSLKRCWLLVEWPLVGILALVAFVLGYLGLGISYDASGYGYSPPDLVYDSLRLFVFEAGLVPPPVPWQLQVARFLAPAVVVYTAVKTIAALLYGHLQRYRMRFIKDHVVICGLGRKGLLLVKYFIEDQGRRVVVIDQNAENSKLDTCKELGATVIVGNATDKVLLRRARVETACYLISVCGSDGANAEIAINSGNIVEGQREKALDAFIHIADLELSELLREKELYMQKLDAFRSEFFNVFDKGAKVMLDEYPAVDSSDDAGTGKAHILVIGLGAMGSTLVREAGRIEYNNHGIDGERLRITVIDRLASQKVESLCLRYPKLEKVCDITPLDLEINSSEFQRAGFLFDSEGAPAITTAYVCLDGDDRSLSTALTLHQRLRNLGVPIVVRMSEDAGLAALLRGEDGDSFSMLKPFSLLEMTCTPELVTGGINEAIAIAMHEDYIENQEKEGKTPETNDSMVSWELLPDHLKKSNRHQADHIGVKLKSIGCALAPLTDWDAGVFEFTPDEFEKLSHYGA